MGTLGIFQVNGNSPNLSEPFREVYMSGAGAGDRTPVLEKHAPRNGNTGAECTDGPNWMVLLRETHGLDTRSTHFMRNRLKVGLFTADGAETTPIRAKTDQGQGVYVMNELLIHRGKEPHLAVVICALAGAS